jgi:hypothetical protein
VAFAGGEMCPGLACGFTGSFETLPFAVAGLWCAGVGLRATGFFVAGFDFVAILKNYSWLNLVEPSPLLVSHPVCGQRREFPAPSPDPPRGCLPNLKHQQRASLPDS